MEAKELMIGDWARISDDDTDEYFDAQIKGVDFLDNVYAPIPGEETPYPFSIDCVEPIPLTPEILEKNGFEKLDFSHFQIGDRRLVLDADGRWAGPLSWHWVVTEMDTNAKGQPVVLDYYVATINYVHELQHALRLCGIDKEIVV